MKSLVVTKETLVWFVLTLLTCVSWLLADGYQHETVDHYKYFTIGLLLLAFFKVRLVVMHFMEVGRSPIALKGIFELWLVVVPVVIIGLYLKAEII